MIEKLYIDEVHYMFNVGHPAPKEPLEAKSDVRILGHLADDPDGPEVQLLIRRNDQVSIIVGGVIGAVEIGLPQADYELFLSVVQSGATECSYGVDDNMPSFQIGVIERRGERGTWPNPKAGAQKP